MTDLLDEKPHRSWAASARAFLSPKVLALLFLGFSAGVPILLVFSTLSLWLNEAGVERATIGFFSWAALAYSFKVVWAPLIDKLPVPGLFHLLGRRRSWLLVAQLAVIAALMLMAQTNPVQNLMLMALGALALAFSSATQDIVIDAYRIEAADEDLQGLMAATYIMGYRIGMIVAGAGALEIAGVLEVIEGYDYNAWRGTYFAMAGVMGIGVLTTLVISEPEVSEARALDTYGPLHYLRFFAVFACAAAAFVAVFFISSDFAQAAKDGLKGFGLIPQLAAILVEAVRLGCAVGAALILGVALVKLHAAPRQLMVEAYVEPFAEFFSRFGRVAFLILALVATFRISDVVMGVMANVFYDDLGFSKQEIGRVTKLFGLIMTIAGGFLGGLLTVRYGVMKTLFIGGVMVAITNGLFAFLAGQGPDIRLLAGVIAADNLSAGIASAAFVAYLSSLTAKGYTATQYALFSSMMLLLPKLIAGYSGMMVDAVGYAPFFIGTALMGMIPLVLIVFVARLVPKH